MSTVHGPSSSPKASSSKLDSRVQASLTGGGGGKGKAKEESPALAGGLGGGGDQTTSATAKKPSTKKNKHPKGTGPGKGWRAGRGGGSAGKRTRKKPEVDEPPNKYRDKFVALRDEFDLATTTHTARVAELEATLGTLNRIQEENDFLLDAARRSLDQRPRLALFLERTTSPPREMSPLPDESSRPSHQPTATETRIAGPIPASGREPLEGAVAPDDLHRRSKRQRLG